MSTLPANPENVELQVKVYDGDRLLTEAACVLWLDANPRHGSMAVPGNQNWLRFPHLTLDAGDGTRYSILPTRLAHTAGQLPTLLFDIE